MMKKVVLGGLKFEESRIRLAFTFSDIFQNISEDACSVRM